MKIVFKNDIEIYEPSKEIIDYCKSNLIIDNPDYLNAKRMGRYTGRLSKELKLYVKSGNKVILPFGCLKDIWGLRGNAEIVTCFHDFRGNFLNGSIKLYDYQQSALEALKSGKNGVLEAPCGSGKTQIALQLIKEIGGKALWLTHTKKLLEQSKSRCEMYFKGEFGEITEGKVEIGRDITFATVQTISKVDVGIYKNEFDIIIVDECHHCVGSPTKVMQFYKVLTNCNARYKYGLSATLTRSDNMIKTLFSIIGKVLFTIKKIDVGNKIIKARHIQVPIDLIYKIEDYLNFDGTLDYNKMINVLSTDDRRNKKIIDNVFNEYQKGNKQIILCHRIKQVEDLSNKISKFCKVNCITGRVNQKTRKYDGDVIIATYQLAKEGLDIPELNVLHFATPQKNASTTEQSVGRIERNINGKKEPICYDYVDISIPYCLSCYKQRKRILNKS